MVGTQLGRYRITQQLGAGGMGLVYRAHDDRLDRDVAIKVLPPDALANEVVRHRFHKEALALSRLNHPNIATLFDFDTQDGIDFLVMEEVSGAALDSRLAAGALKPADVVRLGQQLAEALAAAHEQNVLHRDLKPSNLRLTHDGRLKVLDFGLAQTIHPITIEKATASMSDYGSAAGTLPYMSPEQIAGEEPDFRSDIYAAGVVLFEMATGRHPFEQKTGPALISDVLHTPAPAARSLAPGISAELERIIGKCLEKDPGNRYQSARELAVDLRRLELSSAVANAVAPGRYIAPWLRNAVLAGVALAVLLFLLLLRPHPAAMPTAQAYVPITDFPDSAAQPSLSSDGRMVTFIRGPETFLTPGQVYVKFLPDGQPVQLTHDNSAKMGAVFSPDGSRIAYTAVDQFHWQTYEVPVIGGTPRLMLPNAAGLSWLDGQHLLFSEVKTGIHMGLVTATESRAEQRDVYLPSAEAGMVHRSYPSPDRKNIVVVEMNSPRWLRCRLLPFDGSSPGKPIGPDGHCTSAAWSPDGKWIYLSSDAGAHGFHIWRQRYPDGAPEQVTSGLEEEEGIALAPDGKSFITAVGTTKGTVWLHDQKGDRQISSEAIAFAPQISTDGKTLYYLAQSHRSPLIARDDDQGGSQLMRVDLASGASEPLLPGERVSEFQISADGKRILYTVRKDANQAHLWMASLDRRFPPRQVSSGNDDNPVFLPSGDILFCSTEGTTRYVYRMKPDGSDRHKLLPTPVVWRVTVSPDEQWVAASAPISGDESSIAFQAYHLADGKAVRICEYCSVSWSQDGKYLYYLAQLSARKAADASADAGVIYAIPLKSGQMLPAMPAGGVRSEADLLKLGAVVLPSRIDAGFFVPGPSPAIFPYTRRSTTRNLYRIPVPGS